jgi:hypothetical protein
VTREPSGAGRHVTVTVRLTAAEAASIDKARGNSKRETFLRAAGLASARALAAERKAGLVEVPEPKGCPPHPKRRVVKALCGACGRNVGDEKVA